MFDSPQPLQQTPNRPAPNPLSSTQQQRRHSHHSQPRISFHGQSPVIQNQRVAQILQATGRQQQHTQQQQQQPTSPVNANRSGQSNNNFYASSAPSSSTALSNKNQSPHHHSRPAKPPVPLFHQSTGSVPTAKMMNAADVDLDEFAAFENGGYTAFSSPAVTTNLDFSGSASSSMSNLGTVSPTDLLVGESFLSAPNSSALTALTSPSINESPDFDQYDVSPNFGSADFEYPTTDNWYSLFPPNEAGIPEPSKVDLSPAQQSDDLDLVDGRSISSARRKSGASPVTGTPRHSSVSGVNARKRDKPLPPIVIDDPSDTVAMKRARNTLAARKSRERKAQKLDELEDRIAKLEAERDHWKSIALGQSGAEN